MGRLRCTLRAMAFGIGLAALSGCGGPSSVSSDWKRIEPSTAAEEFALPQLGGGSVRLSDCRGQVVVLEFWATWCGPCRFSLPSLETIYRKYQDRGVTVLLIDMGEPPDRVLRWAKSRFRAPILLDREGDVAKRYQVGGIPRLFIVDQQGRLAYTHEGYGGGLERNLTLIVDELLAEDAVPTDG